MSRMVKATILAAAAMLTACSTSAPVEIAAPSNHGLVSSFQNLTRIEIASNFSFEESIITLASASDESDATLTRHETEAHETRREHIQRSRALGERDRSPAISAALTDELPAGWVLDENNMALHRESGLRCPMSVNFAQEERSYALQDIVAFDNKGRDVACNFHSQDGVAITVYASFWPDVTLEDSVAGAVGAIVRRFNVVEELGALKVSLEAEETASDEEKQLLENIEPSVAGGFNIGDVSGVTYKTSLWLTKTHGWHVKVRGTYPLEDQTSELVSAILFASAHLDVRRKNMTNPTAPGAEV